MATLKAMELENGQYVYVQVNESVHFADASASPATDSTTRGGGFERKGGNSLPSLTDKAVTKLSDLISAMSETTSKALQKADFGDIEKVSLEFGITLAGEAGIPYISSGKAEGAVSITIEFKPKKAV